MRTPLGSPGIFPMGPPLTPDPDEARRLLTEELAKQEYQSGRSWFDEIYESFMEWLDSFTRDASSTDFSLIETIGILAILLVLIYIIVRIAMSMRRTVTTSSTQIIDEDDSRTSTEMRTEAERLAKGGSFTAALIERFRAIARSMEERVVISSAPGRTAQELSHAASTRFPAPLDQNLGNAASLFDECSYGNHIATQHDYQRIADLDQALLAASPLKVLDLTDMTTAAGVNS